MVREMANLEGDAMSSTDMAASWEALAVEVDLATDSIPDRNPTTKVVGADLSPSPGDSGEEDAIRVRALQLLMLLDNDGTGTLVKCELLGVHGGDESGILSGLKHNHPNKVSRLEWLNFVDNLRRTKGTKAAGFFLWHLTRNAKRIAEVKRAYPLPSCVFLSHHPSALALF